MMDLISGICLAALIAVTAFLIGFAIGVCSNLHGVADKLVTIEDMVRLEMSSIGDARRALNRTTNTILASIARSGTDDAPVDRLATAQINRRIRTNSQVPGYEGEGDEDPTHWGHYVSHPDEHGYITPMGLTQDAEEGRRWQAVGEEIAAFTRSINERIGEGAAVKPRVVVPQIMLQQITENAEEAEEQEFEI